MSAENYPRPDQIENAPHPRDTPQIIGQRVAEQGFLDAYNADRLHHGWLLTGPRGVGKATLAWRIARFLLANPGGEVPENGLFGDNPEVLRTLDVSDDHPVARRLMAGSEPGFFHIVRSLNEKTGRLRDMIVADDVRRLNQFLHMSATEGGRRVVLIDCAEDMNVQAANALLKMLEEPPLRTTLLLVSHQPARLLPTIRSRCRELRLSTLGPVDMETALGLTGAECAVDETVALTQLSGGSVGEAVRLINLGGLRMYSEITQIAATMPQVDRARALKLAEAAATRGAEDKLDLLLTLVDVFVARLARCGVTGTAPPEAAKDEANVLLRLSPTHKKAQDWARIGQEIGERMRHGRAVNLDPVALVLDTVFRMQKTAAA